MAACREATTAGEDRARLRFFRGSSSPFTQTENRRPEWSVGKSPVWQRFVPEPDEGDLSTETGLGSAKAS